MNPALISGLSFPRGIAVSGSDLFVSNSGNGTIGAYTTAGATVNPALISGLSEPWGIVVSGSDLFIVNARTGITGDGTIGEYTTAGATVNPALISGLPYPIDIAVVPTIPEPGGAILTLFGLVLIGLVVKKIKKDGIPAAGGHTIPTKRQTPTARIFQRLLAAGPSPICWRMGRPY